MRCESCGREFPGSAGDTCPWCGHIHGGGGPSPWQTPQAQATGPRSSGGSAGIPWENEQNAQSLFETVKRVLFSPADTFASAAPMVGLAPGFLFAMILGVAGGVLNTIWQFALGRGTEALGNLPEDLQQFAPVIQAF